MENTERQIREPKTLPEKIKIELTTPMENVFFWAAGVCGFLVFIGLIELGDSGLSAATRVLLGGGVGGLVIFVSLYRNTDNYYIFDIPAERILYHFKFYSIRNITEMMKFSEVAAVTVDGKREHSKTSVWWEYRTVIVDRRGQVFPMSDRAIDGFEKAFELAGQIAELTGAKFVEPEKEAYAEVAAGADAYTFVHVPHTAAKSFKNFATIMTLTFLVIGIVIAALAIMQSFK